MCIHVYTSVCIYPYLCMHAACLYVHTYNYICDTLGNSGSQVELESFKELGQLDLIKVL